MVVMLFGLNEENIMHSHYISKSFHTSPLKLVEEAKEFIDAISSGDKIVASIELADLYGALKIQAEKLGLSIADLDKTSTRLHKSYENGDFKSMKTYEDVLQNILKNATSIDTESSVCTVIWVHDREFYLKFLNRADHYVANKWYHKIVEVINGAVEYDGCVYSKGDLFQIEKDSTKYLKSVCDDTLLHGVREFETSKSLNRSIQFVDNLKNNILGI